MAEKPEKSFDEVIRTDGRYPPDAYAFLHEGVAEAVKRLYGAKAGDEESHARLSQQRIPRHVTGQQICHALRELALQRWGMLAMTVLGKWNIRQTLDFGNMVYLLIQNQFMKKTEEDSLEDFRDVYDFAEAFGHVENFEMKE